MNDLRYATFPAARSHARGFTLLELMTVVMIIAILAVIAVPGAARMIRERRSATAASYIVEQFRLAKARSLGRSSAVMVRYNAGRVQVIEAIAGTGGSTSGCALVPRGACTLANFSSSATSQMLDEFNPVGAGYQDVSFQLSQYVGSTPTVYSQADICYSSSGLTWIRTDPNVEFAPMTTGVDIRVRMETGSEVIGVERHIYVLPNEMARLAI